MAIQGGRPDNRQIVPFLFVSNGAEALEYYRSAFGAEVLYRSSMPSGKGIFAQLRIGESVIQVGDEDRRQSDQPASPETLGGTSVILEMYVDDVDASYRRAVDAGGSPAMPPFDTFFGDRYGWVRDPYGHTWALATVRETVTPEEIERRIGEFAAQASQQHCVNPGA